MTEEELIEEITLLTTAIHNIYKTGQKYEIGTGQSKRVFEAASYKDLKKEKKELMGDLATLNAGGAGTVLGY